MTGGGCLSGAGRDTVAGPPRPPAACHCTQCRRTRRPCAAASPARRGSATIAGGVACYRSSPGARRGVCPVCGSSRFRDGRGADLAVFAGTRAGAADPDPTARVPCG